LLHPHGGRVRPPENPKNKSIILVKLLFHRKRKVSSRPSFGRKKKKKKKKKKGKNGIPVGASIRLRRFEKEPDQTVKDARDLGSSKKNEK
jgi:hypothetical protein